MGSLVRFGSVALVRFGSVVSDGETMPTVVTVVSAWSVWVRTISSARSASSDVVGFCLRQGGVVPLAPPRPASVLPSLQSLPLPSLSAPASSAQLPSAFGLGACPSGQMRNTLFLSG